MVFTAKRAIIAVCLLPCDYTAADNAPPQAVDMCWNEVDTSFLAACTVPASRVSYPSSAIEEGPNINSL